MTRISLWPAVLLLLVSSLRAHDPGLSAATVRVRADAVDVQLAFNPNDLRDAGVHDFVAFGRDVLRVAVGGSDGALLRGSSRVNEIGDVQIDLELTRAPGDEVVVQLRAGGLARAHRSLVTILAADGSPCGEALLGRRSDTLAVKLAPVAASGWADVPRFVGLGIEHILIGYDHILFLLALLLVGTSLRSAAAIITSFTVAHSLTLALASLGLLRLPAALVEPAIALSIVCVAVQNLLVRAPAHRWRVTFAFGLLHGFGFASVLEGLGLGARGSIAVPLFSFNLGVEIGQLALAALALPLLRWLGRRPFFARKGTRVMSAVIALVGAWWLVERTLLA
jgi:hydrogenase/urease accessory protein HupE